MEKLLNRVEERWWEHLLGIHTRGTIRNERLGNRSDAIDYTPVPFRAFFQAMEHVPSQLLTGTFLDYGSGKGRALVLAARRYPFQRVIGVEMNRDLCLQAKHNLKYGVSKPVEIACCDAANYQPPSDTTVFFFYNPFFGETMKRVAGNIHQSLLSNPREVAIVAYTPVNFLAATAGQDWFEERAVGKVMYAYWRVFGTRIDAVSNAA
jgi:SAM-dependent methyltransferase